jgi:nucleoside 2-deoxyribosyltransferase
MKYIPSVYLAGAIRTEQDYVWRKDFVREFKNKFLFRIPSDIITMGVNKGMGQFNPTAYMTYRTDIDLIDRSEIVVANLLPMADGYPSIGTLFEVGYARAKGKLLFIVADAKRKEHPFLAFGADGFYANFGELYDFLHRYLDTLNGECWVFDKV